HINTGMHRAGCSPHDALSLAQQIDSNPHLKLAGLMTHFTSSEDPQHDSLTHEQEKLFSTCIQKIHAKKIYPRWLHAANTEGARRFSFPQFNLVRIGIGLYSPHPTLSIRSQIVSITDALPGDTVGYGRTHQITHKTKVGVIPLGYSDGFETALGTERTVWIDRIPLPVIGKVCMDFSMIDLTNYPQAKIGQTVTIPLDLTFQNGYPPPHAKMTAIGPRVKRIFYE
ncbi:MAG: alanine racemase, partial [Chlamydiia bacterium]|nr:alanine racemase [Chlamydiia bacterium]